MREDVFVSWEMINLLLKSPFCLFFKYVISININNIHMLICECMRKYVDKELKWYSTTLLKDCMHSLGGF